MFKDHLIFSNNIQDAARQLQAQLSEGPFDNILSKLNPKKLSDAPEYIKPNIKRGENNLTPRPISDEDYKKSDVKGEISRRFKKLGSIKPENTETDEDIIQMRQNAADQGGIPQDMVREPIRRTKQQPDGRLIYGESLPPKLSQKEYEISKNKLFNTIDMDKNRKPYIQ